MNRLVRLLGALLIVVVPLQAAVDLVTLPRRDSTQLTIYNSVDLTMVRESRSLTVNKGVNRIQFSWANTLIDPTSIEFRILTNQSKVDLLETTFPRDRNQALQWNINSEIDGPVQIEIRYFTSGITWSAKYTGVTDETEKQLDFKGYIRIINKSGEEYDNAEVRLVVGKINLVETIAQLATSGPEGASRPMKKGYSKQKSEVKKRMRQSFSFAVNKAVVVAEKAPQVEKQGLSEYFLFTIEGRETIKNNEPVQLLALDVTKAPLEPLYRCSDRTHGTLFTKYYRFKNKKFSRPGVSDMNNLGTAPIPDGLVMLYSEYKNLDLAFMGQSHTKYVPIGARLESSLGYDMDLSLKRRVKDQHTHSIVARRYRRRENNTWVRYYDFIDYDVTYYWEEEVVNGKDKTIKCEIERRFDNDVLLKTRGETPKGWSDGRTGAYVDFSTYPDKVEKIDSRHIKIHVDLKPGEKRIIPYTVTIKHRGVGPELNSKRVREQL